MMRQSQSKSHETNPEIDIVVKRTHGVHEVPTCLADVEQHKQKPVSNF